MFLKIEILLFVFLLTVDLLFATTVYFPFPAMRNCASRAPKPKMNIIIISFHGGITVNNVNCLKIVIFQLHVLLIKRLLTVSIRVNFAFCI